MILFLTVGLNLCVGALLWDIIAQPTIPILFRIILFVLCGVILGATTVILRWDLKQENWRLLWQKMIKNKRY